MATRAIAFPAPLRFVLWPVAIVGGATLLALVACIHATMLPGLIAICFLTLFLALSRLKMAGLTAFFIVADHFCQFMKRMIFLMGDQTKTSYYTFQLLPTMILALAFLSAIWLLRRVRFSPAAYALLAYFVISGVTTLVSPGGANMNARFSGLDLNVLPIAGYFIGMTLPLSAWPRIAKLFMVLLVISVPWGVYQLIFGPTPVDTAWALATHTYSVEAWKVWMYLKGAWPEFRAYAYYSDHLMWGTFVMNATLFILACVSMKVVPRYFRVAAMVLGAVGLLACETRGVWISFIGALVIYRIISKRGFRRPMLMMSGVAASFVIVIALGGYLREHVNFALTSSSILNRYLTVGTIAARTSAPKIFIEELPRHALYGGGFGTSYLNAGMDASMKFSAAQYSHNLAVDLLLDAGLPGLLSICFFLYFWIKEAFWTVKVCDIREARAIRWIIALMVGGMLSSGINSFAALNFYLFFLAGLVTAEWSRKKIAYDSLPRLVTVPRRTAYPVALDVLAPSR